MLVQPNAAASGDSLLARLKEAVLKLTWKHALLISLPLCLYIYPKPVMRLFMPLASKLSNNHPDVACNETLEQIILTTNPELTPAALAKTHVLKGTPPRLQNYAQNEVVTIELFSSERRANLFSSFSTLQPHAYNEESVNLYGETLWNSFRLTKIENPQMKALIIRSSQPILVQFLLKFYKISRSESHKIGVVTDSRLVVLRLDRRVGTYEHLTCELQKF